MAKAIPHQRSQQLDLALGLEYRLVGAVEVIEVAEQCLDAAPHVERFEHVAAHEIGQIAN